jgi:SAM-dependent methyltransferase
MNDFWNERYSSEEFAYGEAPNNFMAEQLRKLRPGKILFPAEGEGRNAVYAATLGWQVSAFDPSSEGKKKAEQLATKHNVEIDYQISGYENADFQAESFDCLILISAHMPPSLRKTAHKKLATFLKPGGTLIFEGFSKAQINKNTGGPKNIDFLFSEEELQTDFQEFSSFKVVETERTLDEGPFHQGIASVLQAIGTK